MVEHINEHLSEGLQLNRCVFVLLLVAASRSHFIVFVFKLFIESFDSLFEQVSFVHQFIVGGQAVQDMASFLCYAFALFVEIYP